MKMNKGGGKMTEGKKSMSWQGATPEKAPMQKKVSGVGKARVGKGSATAKFNRGR